MKKIYFAIKEKFYSLSANERRNLIVLFGVPFAFFVLLIGNYKYYTAHCNQIYNNGICLECGGKWELVTNNEHKYIYECDNEKHHFNSPILY